jgi:hypothetical protein
MLFLPAATSKLTELATFDEGTGQRRAVIETPKGQPLQICLQP